MMIGMMKISLVIMMTMMMIVMMMMMNMVMMMIRMMKMGLVMITENILIGLKNKPTKYLKENCCLLLINISVSIFVSKLR